MKKINKAKEKAISVNKQLLNLEVNPVIIEAETGKKNQKHLRKPIQTLTIEELNLLAKAECKYPLLKNYVLFSAITGMPFKEMQNLCWSHIESSELFGIRVKMRRQKTKKLYLLNISEQAYKLLGERKEATEKVFESLNDRDRYYNFQLWLAEVGIKKELTFHDLRHTYAFLQLTLGADIRTLRSPQESMYFDKIIDQRKCEAGNKIQLDLRKDLPDLMNFLSGPDIATLRRYMGHLNP